MTCPKCNNGELKLITNQEMEQETGYFPEDYLKCSYCGETFNESDFSDEDFLNDVEVFFQEIEKVLPYVPNLFEVK